MSDSTLTIEQYRKLIHELATNDNFRLRYEDKPAAALLELGIPPQIVVNLKASCLASKRLPGKEVFQAASEKLDDETAQVYAAFHAPTANIGTGKS